MSIISPWIIYLIALLDAVDTVAIFGLVVGFGGFILFTTTAIEEDDETAIKHRSIAKKIKWLGIISLILVTLIPSRKDMYTMLVADTVTYEMVDTVGEGVKGTVDYVVDAVDQMLNGEKE